MKKEFLSHPAYENSLSVEPSDEKEMKKAKNKAGVTTHEDAMNRAKEYAESVNDKVLLDKINNEIDFISNNIAELESKLSSLEQQEIDKTMESEEEQEDSLNLTQKIKRFIQEKKEELTRLLEKREKEKKNKSELLDINERLKNFKKGDIDFMYQVKNLGYSKETYERFAEDMFNELLNNVDQVNFAYEYSLRKLEAINSLGTETDYERLYLERGKLLIKDWFKKFRSSDFLFNERNFLKDTSSFFYSGEIKTLKYLIEKTDLSADDLVNEVLDFFEKNDQKVSEEGTEEVLTTQNDISAGHLDGYANPSLIGFGARGGIVGDDYCQCRIYERFTPLKQEDLENLENNHPDYKQTIDFINDYLKKLTTDNKYNSLRNKEVINEIKMNRTNVAGIKKRTRALFKTTRGRIRYQEKENIHFFNSSYKETSYWLNHFLKNPGEVEGELTEDEISLLSKKALEAHASAIASFIDNAPDYELKAFIPLLEKNNDYETIAKIYRRFGRFDLESEVLKKSTKQKNKQ